MSAHERPHCLVPAPHSSRHMPPLHRSPPAQVTPHAPQFISSPETATQTPPQSSCPDGQLIRLSAAQLPARQTSPLPQTTLQPPQLRSSVAVLTQDPPQAASFAPPHSASPAPPEQAATKTKRAIDQKARVT